MPLNKVGSYNKINDAYISFVQEFEREPSDEELAEVLGISTRDVQVMMRGNNRHVSLDAPLSGNEEGDATMLDVMIPEESGEPDLRLMADSLKEEIAYGLHILSPRETEVISSYYGINGYQPLTLDEIGELYGLTRERVRQIKERALRRLRKSSDLKAYLG
jgi:RNA polymerase primary sigma factor